MSSYTSRSANSGQKSKKTSNSNSSNAIRNNNNDSKKRKSNQKTLGMAWGANSPSSSRSSFLKSPFSDVGSYMAEKNRKLQHQFDAAASSSGKPIFQGVSIFVDGFTVPSSQELRGYMLKYGGRYENYFSRQRVTHIICSNLPESKIKNLRSFSGGLPVVKPTWVADCVTVNRLLSWVPYQLEQLSDNQPKLSAFFSPRCSPLSEVALVDTNCQFKTDIENSSFKGELSEDSKSCKGVVSVEQRWESSGGNDGFVQEETNAALIKAQSYFDENHLEVKLDTSSNAVTETETYVKNEGQSCFQQPSTSVHSHYSDNQNTKVLSTSVVAGPSDQRHSTIGDPNFVENYFKNSRLHFIGTWRNRYRKRFPSWYKCINSYPNGSDNAQKTVVIHIDMDCFFVSVVIRNHPELQDKAVAVCHSDNPKGTAEISSASYPARAYGIKAGMFVRDAKALCPHLVILPYNFEAYEEVADQFYDILHKHCKKVQAVSCDEAFLDATYLEGEDPEIFASIIRKEIFETTGCSASAGISKNMLMARLATRSAKPAGQCYIPPERVDEYLCELPIKALPGIGHVLEQKLKKQNLLTCGQLRLIEKDSLQKDFGLKTGEMLWNSSRGLDNRLVGMIQESKSIGAEVNWGVRFRDWQDSQNFLSSLCREVSLRLQGCGVQGRTFLLKIKKRTKGALEPSKYMGCGDCENLSHSITIPVGTDDVDVLQRISKQLFGSFHLDVKDIRGVGMQVSKLESADTSRQGLERNSMKSWLASASVAAEHRSTSNANKDREEQSTVGASGTPCSHQDGICAPMDSIVHQDESLNQVSTLPPLCHLDMEVIECLPPEVLSELNERYDGKLIDFMATNRGRNNDIRNSLNILPGEPSKGAMVDGNGALSTKHSHINIELVEKHTPNELLHVPVSEAELSSETTFALGLEKTDLMPSSLSQIDPFVLQQLPEELRCDILDLLPEHRQNISIDAHCEPHREKSKESEHIMTTENQPRFVSSDIDANLWTGNPPKWVEKFECSNTLMLKLLADIYKNSPATAKLSSVLQGTVSKSLHFRDPKSHGWDEAISSLCDLLRQFINMKIQVDLEEIYVSFRILKRLSMKSELFHRVYSIVFPYLQASVGENYGGNLHISTDE